MERAAVIKDRLHERINEINDAGNDDEVHKMLKEREATYLTGEDKAYTLEEFKAKFEKEHGL